MTHVIYIHISLAEVNYLPVSDFEGQESTILSYPWRTVLMAITQVVIKYLIHSVSDMQNILTHSPRKKASKFPVIMASSV